MPSFDVLSGTWYRITAPNLETAQKAYDAYWDCGDEIMPEGCTVEKGEVDSHWIPLDLDGPDLTLEEFIGRIPNQTTIDAMKEAME